VVFAPVFGPPTVEPEDGEPDGLSVGLSVLVGELPVPVGVLVGELPVPVGVLVGELPVPVGVLVGLAEDVADGLAAGEPLGAGQFEVTVLGYGATDGIAVCPPDVT
jgi:hypothetical protein